MYRQPVSSYQTGYLTDLNFPDVLQTEDYFYSYSFNDLNDDPKSSGLARSYLDIYDYANQYIVSHQYEPALEALLYILKQDMNFQDGEAKAAMLKIFEILGPQEALTRSYRSKLATLLY